MSERMSRLETWALRLLLLVIWPLIAVAILGFFAATFVLLWFAVTMVEFERNADGVRIK